MQHTRRTRGFHVGFLYSGKLALPKHARRFQARLNSMRRILDQPSHAGNVLCSYHDNSPHKGFENSMAVTESPGFAVMKFRTQTFGSTTPDGMYLQSTSAVSMHAWDEGPSELESLQQNSNALAHAHSRGFSYRFICRALP